MKKVLFLMGAIIIVVSLLFANFTDQTIIYVTLSVLAGIWFAKFYYMMKLEKYKTVERQNEKLSVSKDTSASKIFALEAKIQTLEIALEKALKNKE